MSNNQEENTPIIIKKYSNRRLYDTSSSSYITLDDLCNMVKQSINFQVIDAKTSQDLTRNTLTQIIFEQESKGHNLLPINFLRNIINFYNNDLKSNNHLPQYLEETMDYFVKSQQEVQKNIQKNMQQNIKSNITFPDFNEISRQNIKIFQNAFNMFSPFSSNNNDDNKNKE